MTPHLRHLHPVLCAFLSLLISAEPPRQPPTALAPPPAPAFPAIDPAALSAGADEGWWQTVSARIEREEYHASPTPAGLQAPNRAHNLRTTFHTGGFEVAPRQQQSEGGETWRFTWRTSSWGRQNRMQAVEPTVPQLESHGSRVHYTRQCFDEWYRNGRNGLEQGFTVHARPPGEGSLRLEGHLGGALRAELRDTGAVDFLDEHGTCVLRYAELRVWDAGGNDLPSQLAVEGEELTILVDDRGARYPIIVDPLMTSPAWTAESDQVGANFGISVGTAGDVNGDGFSDVIVGAFHYSNDQPDEGRVFVYHGSDAGLATSPAWTAESNQDGAGFGNSVGTSGDVNGDGFSDVIVGAYLYTNGQTDEGRAFVYHGSAAGLATSPAWTSESDQAFAYSGISVGTAGDVNGDGFSDVIVGAYGYDNEQTGEGRAFVYHGSDAGLATSPAWTAESNQDGAQFGNSVGTSGDVNGDGFSDVIVGAHRYDNEQTDEGRAFVYHGSDAGLATSPAWTAESNQDGAQFGNSVGTSGDVSGDGFSDVIVGADAYDNGQFGEGRAFVYHGSAAGLSTSPTWTAESDQVGAVFGFSVGTAGDVNGDGFSDVIVGAYQYTNGEGGEGRAFAYHGSAAGLATSPAWTAESDQAGANFGYSVGTAGDVNGDGFSDVIVGANGYDNGEPVEGRAFVYHGSAEGLATSPAWTGESNQASAEFGESVGTAGDVNGDGFSDVIVGAPYYDNGQEDEGQAFVYHGSAGGLANSPAWTAESDRVLAQFGYSVGTAGDVNGDGFSDVIVGAPTYEGQPEEGRAFVYHGSAAGLATSPAWTARSNQPGAFFGISVGTAGDVNGDGFSDVIIGAMGYNNGQTDEGRAFAYLGSGAGLPPPTSPGWTAESNQANGLFGNSVGTAGDVNGDGYSDVIVGAWFYDNGQTNEGRVFAYHGSAAGLATAPAWIAESDQAGALFGASAATAGDVNGDGFSDVIVGAHVYDNGEADEGRVFAYHGSAEGLATAAAWSTESNQSSVRFGVSAGTAGDVNGDGFSDVIVGAQWYNNGQSNEGRAFAYYGNAGDGLNRSARQARTDDSAPISILGVSDSETGFRIKALGRTPAGRGQVRLQWEVKPLGTSFDGTGLATGPAFDTGTPSMGVGSVVPLSELASGLTADTVYHWRLRIVTDSPFFPRSPWLWLSGNATTEADVRTRATTGVTEHSPSGARFWLEASAPNPFAFETQLAYTLPYGGQHRLAVYDVAGRQVALLAEGFQPAGRYRTHWNGSDQWGHPLPAGTYFVRLELDGQSEARKVTLTR